MGATRGREIAIGEGKDDAEAAETLTDRLLDGIGNIHRKYYSQALEIFVADVESDIDRFNLQLTYCNGHNLPFPCLDDPNAEPVPLDVSFIPEMFLSGLEPCGSVPGLDFLRENSSFFKSWGLQYREYTATEAALFLRNRLSKFLTTRFSARQSNISKRPGLPFRVITQRLGLRVQYARSYFINPSSVFGGPTSPVDAWIQPGRYKFGAVGENFPLKLDPFDFDIPPLTEAFLVDI